MSDEGGTEASRIEGRRRTTSTFFGHGSVNNAKRSKGISRDEILASLFSEAEYEINRDPYRGLRSYLALREQADKNVNILPLVEKECPWSTCLLEPCNGTLAATTVDDSYESDFDSVKTVVHGICGTYCPSVIRWTQKSYQDFAKKRSKRKRNNDSEKPPIGSRPHGPSLQCACDYNMFCLSSLGGVMNEILANRLRENSKQRNEVIVIEDAEMDETISKERADILNFKSEMYSPITSQKLGNLRKSQAVCQRAIRRYLSDTLLGLTSIISIDECIGSIRRKHQSLLFANPLLEPVDATSDNGQSSIEHSIPPGIQNLGATCYLNTQLQCLALNRVFVDGILSWRPAEVDSDDKKTQSDRMTSVILLFQRLLALSNFGPYSSLSTIEFSNALGLDVCEQQDPNEFSRLLFERLHESFQATSSRTKTEECDLAGLLPHLFEGEIEYETKCLHCNSISRRTEKFMDLNLPIVKPSQKTAGQQKIEEAFLKADSDTDVQYCLDQYCCAENLDGDNQYMCNSCNCKRDAIRSLNFLNLPSVLNVQLSRYIFDRATLMKKKRSDKVLLPLELSVSIFSQERCAHVKRRYVLCAVMRHLGKSAQSGHYVAEAMDWSTGQWFEFNDEVVTLLECGPSCSYVPTAATIGKISKARIDARNEIPSVRLKGSQDAYNMYYVEESFLAQNVFEHLRKKDRPPPSVVHSVILERSNYFENLSQLCIDDGKIAKRLQQRRSFILERMFPHGRIDILPTNPSDAVLVDGDFLRRFMSCRKDSLDASSHYLRAGVMCPHQKLHPRIARKGKLVPRRVYQELIGVLCGEFESNAENMAPKCQDLAVKVDEIICDVCSADYCIELEEKVSLVEQLKSLYDELDSRDNAFGLASGPDETFGNECVEYAYVVSKKFATWLRGKVSLLMKKVATEIYGVADGLDALYPSDLKFGDNSFNDLTPEQNELSSLVNGTLTCVHGNFKPSSRQSYFFVPFAVWRTIKTFFPNAIEYKIRRSCFYSVLETDQSDILDEPMLCPECSLAVHIDDAIRSRLSQFTKYCKENGERFEHPSRGQLVDSIIMAQRHPCYEKKQYRIVHKQDILTFQNFLSRFIRKSRSEKAFVAARSLFRQNRSSVASCLFKHNCRVSPTDVESERLQLLSLIFRPTICQKHGHLLFQALCGDPNDACAVNGTPLPHPSLDDDIVLMDEDSHQYFLSHVVAIVIIMVPDDVDVVEEFSIDSCLQAAQNFCTKWKINNSVHPNCFFAARVLPGNTNFTVSTETMSTFISVEVPACNDGSCRQVYLDCFERDVRSLPGKGDAMADNDIVSLSGNSENNPIAIDSEVAETLETGRVSIRVFDVQANASVVEFMNDLSTVCSNDEEMSSSGLQLRRSTRKRKTIYPTSVILTEEVIATNIDNNVAALRLLLLEQCTKGTEFELDHRITLLATNNATSPSLNETTEDQDIACDGPSVGTTFEPDAIELSFDLSTDSLREVCERIGVKNFPLVGESQDFALLRQAANGQKSPRISKDELMDHFIGLANTTSDVLCGPEGTTDQTKRQRKAERGFHGTFLSSGPRTSSPDVEDQAAKVFDPKEGIGYENGSRNSSNACISSAVDLSGRKVHKRTSVASGKVVSDVADVTEVTRSGSRRNHKVYNQFERAVRANEGPSLVVAPAKIRMPNNILIHSDPSQNGKCGSDLGVESISDPESIQSEGKIISVRCESGRSKKRIVVNKVDDGDSDKILAVTLSSISSTPFIGNGLSNRGRPVVPGSSPPPTVENSSRADTVRVVKSEIFDRVHQLSTMILNLPDVKDDQQETCFLAAQDAVKCYPKQRDLKKLIDHAYASFLQRSAE